MFDNSRAHKLYREVTRAAWLGLLVNLGLGLAKLIGGIFGNSFALIADAVNSLGDVVTTVVVLFSLRVAQLPADDEHPYGHTRAEGIAAYTVSLLIIGSALIIGWEAFQRLTVGHAIPPIWTLWIAGVNVLIKEGLYRYKLNVGKRTGSTAIIANAWDHRSDALCAGAVLIGLSLIRWGGEHFIWADEAASLVVVAMIIWSGLQLLRRSTSELLDVQAEPEFVQSIRNIAQTVPGVQAVEKLWVRKSGLEFFVDIHLHVASTMTVSEGHEIGHRLKDQLMDACPTLRDVLVHLEPAEIEARP
jgi:cation diffusion facilitator family transporter